MEEEMQMIRKYKTWELVERPKDKKVIGVRWVFITKLNADGSINKHKTRLVVKGYAQEEIFVEQPEGFVEDKVYLLKKALYDSNTKLIDEFKKEMMLIFEMTDLSVLTYFLGIEIKQSKGEVFICERKYAKEILKKFNMEECKATTTPMSQKESLSKDDAHDKVDESYFRSLIGCLMYLTATRPDIIFTVSILSRFMHCASEMHLKAAKRVMRYIKGTVNFGVKFKSCQNLQLIYSDSDWGGSVDDMKSTSGYCFSLRSSIFSWCSKKQEITA
ncbi:uncharacterized protein LOC110808697 [Carica papaya]|uniref:uncharacterized protein LOC110808697 n=1 Tax=Carica papaya TaxID=3649 RepID=UPI000B8C9E4D|nr:uncharacterized protein LOC110808697 [Carica papaya]